VIHQVCEMYEMQKSFGSCLWLCWPLCQCDMKFMRKQNSLPSLHDDLWASQTAVVTFRYIIFYQKQVKTQSTCSFWLGSMDAESCSTSSFICGLYGTRSYTTLCYSNSRASAFTAIHCLVKSIIRQKSS
jgi:hypothetical protein